MTDNVFAPPRSDVEVKEGPEALWALTWKEIRKLYYASVNVRAIGVLYGLGAVGVIAGGGVLMSSPSGTRNPFLPGLATLFVVLGIVYVAACVSSYTRPTWGRWLGIVLSVLSLLSFPIGTLIGIWMLVAYIQGGRLFGPGRFLHKDVDLVFRQRKKDKK